MGNTEFHKSYLYFKNQSTESLQFNIIWLELILTKQK